MTNELGFLGFLIYTFWIWLWGLLLGYILWAPDRPFKDGLVDGLVFGPLVRLFRRMRGR